MTEPTTWKAVQALRDQARIIQDAVQKAGDEGSVEMYPKFLSIVSETMFAAAALMELQEMRGANQTLSFNRPEDG